ncbi:hypothetical protein ABI59_08725 [Acidobacteria bacterium Mor1]|nr:hypothetical protein ABI59_08725 [Acidobacteria bacterium Mor1]
MRDPGSGGEIVRFPDGEPESQGAPWGRLAGVVATAVVLIGSVLWGVDRLRVPEFEGGGIEVLPAESSEISRSDPVLRWNSLGPGVVYTVEVLTDELNPVALVRDLRRPEFRLPAGTEGLLRGTHGLVWRVQARYPDGRERQSRRFRQRLSAGNGG